MVIQWSELLVTGPRLEPLICEAVCLEQSQLILVCISKNINIDITSHKPTAPLEIRHSGNSVEKVVEAAQVARDEVAVSRKEETDHGRLSQQSPFQRLCCRQTLLRVLTPKGTPAVDARKRHCETSWL
uniref:Uncharacterized protein n=1 Tax=Timema bartmani TaxID=61472 RepID=A0A7R9F962_9NEOP|nr:unnamed protein product [Timema bartmani]